MSTALEDVTAEALDPGYVARRVDDWAARVETLLQSIESWLPPRWSARGRKVLMDEELMRHYGVSPRELPALDLLEGSTLRATVDPLGLWVVGGNGRVDLRGPNGLFVLVDVSEEMGRSAWRIAPANDRRDPHPLDRSTLLAAIS